jgi:hypothetical protein
MNLVPTKKYNEIQINISKNLKSKGFDMEVDNREY